MWRCQLVKAATPRPGPPRRHADGQAQLRPDGSDPTTAGQLTDRRCQAAGGGRRDSQLMESAGGGLEPFKKSVHPSSRTAFCCIISHLHDTAKLFTMASFTKLHGNVTREQGHFSAIFAHAGITFKVNWKMQADAASSINVSASSVSS